MSTRRTAATLAPHPKAPRSYFERGFRTEWGLLCLVFANACGDGVAHPILGAAITPSSNGGTTASAGAAALAGAAARVLEPEAGRATPAGAGSNPLGEVAPTDLPCSMMSEWPSDWVDAEEEMLSVLNALRKNGTSCAGASGASAQPLARMPQLQCLARVHSMTAFTVRLQPSNATEVTVESASPAGLDVPAFVRRLTEGDVDNCTTLLNSRFTSVGIGAAEVSGEGYWTFYLSAAE